MRLEAPGREHALRERIIQRVLRLRLGDVPDVIRTCQHRPEFFGKPFLAWVEAALRGPSRWTQGERELMAALVSKRNSCAFCIDSHSVTVASLVDEDTLRAALGDDPEASGLAPDLRATLEFVEKLTLSPTDLASADVERAVTAGASAQDLRDAVEVCAALNVINRVADALEFAPQDERSLSGSAKLLTTRGYRA